MVIGKFTLCQRAPDSCSCFSTGSLVFARINLRPDALKNFVFDWKCLCLCEVYRFQNLVGLELPIKHTLKRQRGHSFSYCFTKLKWMLWQDMLINYSYGLMAILKLELLSILHALKSTIKIHTDNFLFHDSCITLETLSQSLCTD